MRYLIFSDLHFHHTHHFSHITREGFTVRELEHLSCADTVLKLCKEKNIDKVIFAGDAWGPVSDSMSAQTLVCLTDFTAKIAKEYPFDVLVGNHDLCTADTNIENNNIHKLYSLKYIPNVFVYDKPIEKDNIVYMPFCISDEYAEAYLNSIQNKQEKVVISHLEIKGIDLGNGIFSKKGIDLEVLKQFKYVFQGHYHSGSKYAKNVYIIGSTQRLSFKDLGKSRKNIIIYDTVKDTIERESFACPDWLTFTDENIDLLLKTDPNNYVKVELSTDILLTDEIKQHLQKFKGVSVHIDLNRISVNKQIQEDVEADSESDILRQFINKSDNSEQQKEALIEEGIRLLEKVK